MEYKVQITDEDGNVQQYVVSGISSRHPKCRGYRTQDIGWGSEYECGYETIIDCDECKYGGGRKDPEAKCNQNYR